jgi:hypothetical protein
MADLVHLKRLAGRPQDLQTWTSFESRDTGALDD